jgi:hypothetical protein
MNERIRMLAKSILFGHDHVGSRTKWLMIHQSRDDFELCSNICRTRSDSVVHEVLYRNDDARFCLLPR